MGDAAEAEARTPRGAVLAARAGELAVVLACGPRALGGLARHDLRLVLGDLGAPPDGPADAAFAPLAGARGGRAAGRGAGCGPVRERRIGYPKARKVREAHGTAPSGVRAPC